MCYLKHTLWVKLCETRRIAVQDELPSKHTFALVDGGLELWVNLGIIGTGECVVLVKHHSLETCIPQRCPVKGADVWHRQMRESDAVVALHRTIETH